MTSSRIVLIVLGIILLIIVAFSSNRLTKGIRDSISKLLPNSGKIANARITPTPTPGKTSFTPTPTKTQGQTNETQTTKGGTPTDTIPSTGPAELAWVLLGGSFVLGASLRKLTPRS